MTVEAYGAWEGELEIRRVGGASFIRGVFPYNKRGTTNDRTRVRKEVFFSRAFAFAIEQEPTRKIDLLVGHDFGKPIASRQSGTLAIADSAEAVTFEATLPDDAMAPSWVKDVVLAIQGGTMVGLSPGFRVPPMSVVPNAEQLVPEEGNPGVMVRQVNDAVLREFSVVTAGIYDDAMVELRAEDVDAVTVAPWSVFRWL